MSSSASRPVVLLDVDGTLTDTNYLHTLAWRRAFLEHGHDVASWRIHRLIGAFGSRLVTDLIGAPDDGVKAAWRTQFEAMADEIRPFPGARRLVELITERGGRPVLATSSPGDVLEHHLRALEITEEDLAGVTTDSDVAEAKPAPDVFRTALEQVGGRPEDAIVVGDTGWDLDAASAAGLSAVAVRSGGWTQDELVARGAIEVHDDVAGLVEGLDTSAVGDLLAR